LNETAVIDVESLLQCQNAGGLFPENVKQENFAQQSFGQENISEYYFLIYMLQLLVYSYITERVVISTQLLCFTVLT